MRAIDPTLYREPAAEFEPGAAPMLQWVKIADLVVDDSYQRPIYGAGVSNVRKIAEGFRWSKFAPIVVSPVEGGRFAIIDGQHRATAAALRDIESLPALVVICDPIEQAAAFKAINAATTRVHRLAIHRAAVASGDPDATELQSVTDAAGVTILPYPRAIERLQPGETLAIGAIIAGLKAFGRDTVITALTCITETSCNLPGALSACNITALCALLGANCAWREAGGRLLEAFDEIDLETEAEEARITRRPKGVATWEVLSARLADRLRTALGAGGGDGCLFLTSIPTNWPSSRSDRAWTLH